MRVRGALLAGGALGGLALLVGLSLGGAPAQATFPGQNGRLACEGQRGAPLPDPNLARESRAEVFTINPDGTGETVLTDNRVRDGDPAFSPDGAFITFESFRDGFSEAYKIAADGSSPTRLTESGDNEDRSTNWSPDGTKIAFHSTRDGAASGGDVPVGSSPFEIYVMDADGSNETRITNNTSQDSFPQWSPDGSRLTFTTNRDDGDFEIYTMNPDGSDPQRVTNSPGEDAHSTWSPDGTQLTFHSRRVGGIEIFRQNADGSGDATQVTDAGADGFAFFPVWSPDGTRIAFNGVLPAAPDDIEVYHVNAVDGSDVQRVTNSPGFDGRCDWEAVNAAPPPPGGGGGGGGTPPGGGGTPPGGGGTPPADGDADEARVRPIFARPGANARQKGRRVIVKVTGRLVKTQGRPCKGRVAVGARTGGRKARHVFQIQKSGKGPCTYRTVFRFRVKKLRKAVRSRSRRLLVRVNSSYKGTQQLTGDRAPSVLKRVIR